MANPRVYHSPYPTPHYPTNLSVSQFLLQSDPDDVPGDKVIFADFEDPSRRISYRQLRENATRDAALLKSSYGIQEGDVVCIYAQNSLQWIQLAHAVMWAGGCFWFVILISLASYTLTDIPRRSGINPLASKYELEHYFNVANPKIVAADGPLLANVEHALEKLQIKPLVMAMEDDSQASPRGPPVVSCKTRWNAQLNG